MKKHFLLFALLLSGSILLAQESGNYILIINGDSIPLDLDKEYIRNPDSKKKRMTLKLVQPSILTYSDEMVSFHYDRGLSVSDTKLDLGIEQCMVMKSTGSGFLVQKYKSINPSALAGFMMDEITKESVGYGYEKVEEPYEKTLASGHTIKGIRAVLTYQGEKEVYTVATYGSGNRGVVMVTMLLYNDFEDKRMIDRMVNSLRILE